MSSSSSSVFLKWTPLELATEFAKKLNWIENFYSVLNCYTALSKMHFWHLWWKAVFQKIVTVSFWKRCVEHFSIKMLISKNFRRQKREKYIKNGITIKIEHISRADSKGRLILFGERGNKKGRSPFLLPKYVPRERLPTIWN